MLCEAPQRSHSGELALGGAVSLGQEPAEAPPKLPWGNMFPSCATHPGHLPPKLRERETDTLDLRMERKWLPGSRTRFSGHAALDFNH